MSQTLLNKDCNQADIIITCPRCKGTGIEPHFLITDSLHDNVWNRDIMQLISCILCKGEGKIKEAT